MGAGAGAKGLWLRPFFVLPFGRLCLKAGFVLPCGRLCLKAGFVLRCARPGTLKRGRAAPAGAGCALSRWMQRGKPTLFDSVLSRSGFPLCTPPSFWQPVRARGAYRRNIALNSRFAAARRDGADARRRAGQWLISKSGDLGSLRAPRPPTSSSPRRRGPRLKSRKT